MDLPKIELLKSLFVVLLSTISMSFRNKKPFETSQFSSTLTAADLYQQRDPRRDEQFLTSISVLRSFALFEHLLLFLTENLSRRDRDSNHPQLGFNNLKYLLENTHLLCKEKYYGMTVWISLLYLRWIRNIFTKQSNRRSTVQWVLPLTKYVSVLLNFLWSEPLTARMFRYDMFCCPVRLDSQPWEMISNWNNIFRRDSKHCQRRRIPHCAWRYLIHPVPDSNKEIFRDLSIRYRWLFKKFQPNNSV